MDGSSERGREWEWDRKPNKDRNKLQEHVGERDTQMGR